MGGSSLYVGWTISSDNEDMKCFRECLDWN